MTPDGVSVDELAARLRTGEPSVIARVHQGRLMLDARTVADADVTEVATALRVALEADAADARQEP